MAKKMVTTPWTPTLHDLLASRPRQGMKFGHTIATGENFLVILCAAREGKWLVQMAPADPMTWEVRGKAFEPVDVDGTVVVVMVADARKHNRIVAEGYGYETAHA